MDLQNIQDQLNTEFAKSETRIIFWFDDKGEYEDEVSELQLILLQDLVSVLFTGYLTVASRMVSRHLFICTDMMLIQFFYC